jgi:hypothetical protein
METLVLQELRAVNDNAEHGFDLFFWRTKHGLEVDFVLYGEKGLLAIEVKRGGGVASPHACYGREGRQTSPDVVPRPREFFATLQAGHVESPDAAPTCLCQASSIPRTTAPGSRS